MCNCVDVANQVLAKSNTEIEPIFAAIPGRIDMPVGIRTCKIDKTLRGSAKVLFATFCPFCGVKLDG